MATLLPVAMKRSRPPVTMPRYFLLHSTAQRSIQSQQARFTGPRLVNPRVFQDVVLTTTGRVRLLGSTSPQATSPLRTSTALTQWPSTRWRRWSIGQTGNRSPGALQQSNGQATTGTQRPPEDFKVDGMIGDFIALAIDHREGKRKIYWVEYVVGHPPLYGSQIRRANLDGTGLEVLAEGLARHPIGLALDLVNDEFYWTEYVGGRIQRCPLDGCHLPCNNCASETELVLQTFEGGYHSKSPKLGALALDPANNMMYWTEKHIDAPPPGEDAEIFGGMVKRAKLDGSDVQEIYRFTGANSMHKAFPLGIAIVTASPRTTTTTTTAKGTTCKDKEGWKNKWGQGCKDYARLKWCTDSGAAGPGWHYQWPKAQLRAAAKACCACGGGQ